MTARAKLILEFTGYWVSGTGAARGRDVDVVTYRDAQKLPAMPMTQVKGLLRETAERLAAARCGAWTPPLVVRLFGPSSRVWGNATRDTRLAGKGTRDSLTHDDQQDLRERDGGALGFRGDARLAGKETRDWLAHDDQQHLRERLFARLPATAIDENTGAALDHSLRGIEAAVPVTLEGLVEWVATSDPDIDWVAALDLACAATVAFGKLKGDGYGRVIGRAELLP